MDIQASLILCLDQPDDVLEKFVDVDGPFPGRAARAKQGVDERGKPVGFTDNDIRVFAQFRIAKLAFQKLGGTANAAEGILYFM